MKVVKRSDAEIDAVLNAASAQTSQGGTKWRALTYEEGVENALLWVFGESDDDPMEE